MISEFLERARRDEPVYISEVRAAFQSAKARPFHLQVKLYDGSTRSFPLELPVTKSADEQRFLFSYVYASVYNILSSLGALKIDVYTLFQDAQLITLFESLDAVFQTTLPKKQRSGYGKCLNVNERTLAALRPDEGFSFRVYSIASETAVPAIQNKYGAPVFAGLPQRAKSAMLLGMDVGGTDVKLAVSVDGALVFLKEYDWFPALFTTAEELIDPLLLLTRLMRAAASLHFAGMDDKIDRQALEKQASYADMQRGVSAMEQAAGSHLLSFDAIGLSFPDVVINNRIVGGETYKTRGMRENAALDYEEEFRKVSVLNERLKQFVKPGGAVMNTNDGPMAAFTAAVEQAAVGADVSHGFFAHTLGTELGTGWVKPDGSIPSIPLEVYNFIIDLGSFAQRDYPADDVRSINNFNTLLSGTLQKYASQSGVFRLAAKHLPTEDPALWNEALQEGLLRYERDRLIVPAAPKDMRKPCLEFFMQKAAQESHPACNELFRQIGEYLGATWLETQYILAPEAMERTLFGRLVKSPACFRLICEGARRIVPELVQHPADDELANTPLMQQLAAQSDCTVAQFAQAIGAIYYACLAL